MRVGMPVPVIMVVPVPVRVIMPVRVAVLPVVVCRLIDLPVAATADSAHGYPNSISMILSSWPVIHSRSMPPHSQAP